MSAQTESNGNNGIKLSLSTVQFMIQIVVLILTVSAWGWSIKNEVNLQGERQLQQARETDDLKRRVELMRYDINQLQLALAAKGIITIKGGP